MAVTPEAVGVQRVPGSACAKTAIVVPSAMPPRISPFCSALPTAATRPPASTTVSMNGSGASTRPISSATIATSTGPAPMPPSSSAKGRPSRPISASRDQVFSSKPGSAFTTARRASLSE